MLHFPDVQKFIKLPIATCGMKEAYRLPHKVKKVERITTQSGTEALRVTYAAKFHDDGYTPRRVQCAFCGNSASHVLQFATEDGGDRIPCCDIHGVPEGR